MLKPETIEFNEQKIMATIGTNIRDKIIECENPAGWSCERRCHLTKI